MDAVAEHSIKGANASKTLAEASPVPTLAERRAAAANATSGHRRRSASESSTLLQKSPVSTSLPSPQTLLIPPSLGLNSKTKRLAFSTNATPNAEFAPPLASPSILGVPGTPGASSPAPIQIDRITPRHSSLLARTEEQQRRLDAAMERVNFEDVTVAELKEMLRQRGKHGSGKKADLIKRLQSEIEIIRANRQQPLIGGSNGGSSSNSGGGGIVNPSNMYAIMMAGIPPPLASPTHALNKTLGGMHIGSPPVHPSRKPIAQPGDATGLHMSYGSEGMETVAIPHIHPGRADDPSTMTVLNQ
ncbi:hypothetical protein BGW38_005226 [Lunasporangiospora selenospora]|uniref:SAP domain-containing protein n=1 Tax=Lunasporangiospora selenospora TaxID=979761 RepID=A0A9P6FNA0_9FUNG|nr:hypothetical protein BGW38_005226 [Lunasporangiospora selenospora]